MRRFELSEGTSHKFWQIERTGASFTVTFGRIGTAGQAQTKAFDDADKATTEHDKLVKEKLKKGYAEIATGAVAVAVAAPAAKPKTTPTPAPTAIASTPKAAPAPNPSTTEAKKIATAIAIGSIAWTESALRAISPIRGSDLVAARAPDAKSLYAKIAKAMTACRSLLDAGEKNARADKAQMRAARAAFAGASAPTELDIDAEAAAFALIGPKVAYGDQDRSEEFVRYWFSRAGGAFALRALARASGLAIELVADKSLALLGEGVEKETPWFREPGARGWRGMRLVAVLADDAEHAALVKEAEAIAASANVSLRATLAAAFEHAEWCDADISGLGSGRSNGWLWPVLVSMPAAKDAEKVLAGVSQQNVWDLLGLMDELRYDFVARYGASASKLLIDFIVLAAPYGVDRTRSLGEALALIVAPDVAAFFVGQLAEKDLRPIAIEYLQSHAQLSFALVAEAGAAGKGATTDAAKIILKTILTGAGEAIAAQRLELSPAAQHIIAALEAQTQVREEASDDEIPHVLREPPWTRAITRAPIKIVEVAMLAAEETIAWRPYERERKAAGKVKWMVEETSFAENMKKIREANEFDGVPYRMHHATLFLQLPKPQFLKVAPLLKAANFDWIYFKVAEVLVARHGLEAVDFALRSAEGDPFGAVEAVVRVCSPRVAPLMADAFVRLKRAKASAMDWLLAFPEAAAIGLIPSAIGQPSKAREAAEIALRYVASHGHRAQIEAVAIKYGNDAKDATFAVLDFDPFLSFPSKLPKMPAFWSPGAFTRPLLKGGTKALPLSAVDAIGTMLSFSNMDDPYAGIAFVKDTCDARSLADFAWDLAGAWFASGAASTEQWALRSLAHFGDDESARKLTPLVRAWPGEAAHARAVLGLEVLAKIGTDVALMHLHGIAQKLKFKGLQEKAREKINQIAEARGLTADELADRLVPDLDLDEDGSRSLDFGPRTFRVVFDESLKPAVLDETGKRLPDLPKPKQTDDAAKSEEATDAWKALKKDAKTIASGQVLRLEIAMCAQRRWPDDVFRRFLLEHPLLLHLVRRLVWGTYDDQGKLTSTFRVAEDRTLADSKDDAYELSTGASVGIVHRLDLDNGLAGTWGQILSDYEILQPFAQLSREIATASDDDKDNTTFDRFDGVEIPTGKVRGLDQRGWRRGPPQDGGLVWWYEKPIGELVACVKLDPGIFASAASESPQQRLGDITLRRGDDDSWSPEQCAFGELSAIAFSELVRDLDSLRS